MLACYHQGDDALPTEADLLTDYKAICPIKELTRSVRAGAQEDDSSVDGGVVALAAEEPDVPTSENSWSDPEPLLNELADSLTAMEGSDVVADDLAWIDAVANPSRWLDGRPAVYYPTDPRLPWHFCWIDDGMIGGMSAPAERFHYPALIDAGVGLIVNLTETPILPHIGDSPRTICKSCSYVQESYSDDLFADILPSDDIQVLFLPMPDGSIPSYEQLHVFNKHVRSFIRRGKRVVVHCQAGVGRTGTFLAIYLMEKYGCSADEAISRLRHIRPQSLRFHKTDWASEPFRLYGDECYNRNLLQERFVHRYWENFIKKRTDRSMFVGNETENFPLTPESSITDSHTTNLATQAAESAIDRVPPCAMDEPADTDTSALHNISSILTALIDSELDSKLAAFELYHEARLFNLNSQADLSDSCYPCRGILSVGPHPILPNTPWPPQTSSRPNQLRVKTDHLLELKLSAPISTPGAHNRTPVVLTPRCVSGTVAEFAAGMKMEGAEWVS
ncbi:protein-tyrosine phosphatase-like protein [Phlyctochytrium arcticum]|nr:protein-tyrosine phosphatase-like protein [Phlyctochytrium arcticum]